MTHSSTPIHPVRFCADCAYYTAAYGCGYSANLKRNIVSGEWEVLKSAGFLRGEETFCGPPARWFKPQAERKTLPATPALRVSFWKRVWGAWKVLFPTNY